MKSIHVVERTLPEAWERAVVETWEKGENFPTEYDKPQDKNSRDTTALIHVKEPFAEPRIHRGFPGGLDDLEKYRQEVLFGVHNHWINPAEGKWEYTYNERLFNYTLPDGRNFDQIQEVIDKLKKVPFTRRAQAVTWKVWEDMNISDPSCLQRLWFRISDNKLHMTCHIRSNDAFKAGFMNMYAFTELQKSIADKIGVEPGEYMHIADSFHIYGFDLTSFEGFLSLSKKKPGLEERTFTTEFAQPFFQEGRVKLLHEFLDNPEMMLRKKDQIRIYNELTDEYKSQVDSKVLEMIA